MKLLQCISILLVTPCCLLFLSGFLFLLVLPYYYLGTILLIIDKLTASFSWPFEIWGYSCGHRQKYVTTSFHHYFGSGKFVFSQGKIREKSGNFTLHNLWEP